MSINNSIYPTLSGPTLAHPSCMSLSSHSSLLSSSAHSSSLSLASHYHMLGNEYLENGHWKDTANAWLNAAISMIIAKQQQQNTQTNKKNNQNSDTTDK